MTSLEKGKGARVYRKLRALCSFLFFLFFFSLSFFDSFLFSSLFLVNRSQLLAQ